MKLSMEFQRIKSIIMRGKGNFTEKNDLLSSLKPCEIRIKGLVEICERFFEAQLESENYWFQAGLMFAFQLIKSVFTNHIYKINLLIRKSWMTVHKNFIYFCSADDFQICLFLLSHLFFGWHLWEIPNVPYLFCNSVHVFHLIDFCCFDNWVSCVRFAWIYVKI